MSSLSNPLSATAVEKYVNQIKVELAVPPADAAALAAAIEAFDVSDAAKKERLEQVMEAFGQVAGRNLQNGQVLSLAITTPGADYAVGDTIAVTTAAGAGAAGVVSIVDGAGAITGVSLIAGGSGYDVAETATVITSDAGAGGVVTATVAVDYATMVADAAAAIAAA